MPQNPLSPALTPGQPERYRIRVAGALEPGRSGRLGGLRIAPSEGAGGSPGTSLEGELRDQSALLGVLNTLYELHLPLEAVELVEGS